MAGLSPAHLLIILVIALVVIGPGKLPEVGAAIGKSIREFQKASGGITDTLTGTAARPAQAQPMQPQPMQPQPPAQSYYAAQPVQPTYAAPVYAPPQYAPAAQPPQYGAPVYAPQTGVVQPAAPSSAVNAPETTSTAEHPVG
ncbi:MAG: twin-arginine translocase TatA/TatE family subunit [Candidatus Limnocylindrales bacterium]|jgi:TatA/E family protein of Tat protein translocase